GTIEPEILVSEGRRAVRNNPANLDAFDCCMRGMWHFHQLGAQDNRQAEIWIRRSIELDPKLARAHAMLARVLAVRCWAGYSDDIERDVQVGQAAAERAVTLEDRDPGSHCALAVLSLSLGRMSVRLPRLSGRLNSIRTSRLAILLSAKSVSSPANFPKCSIRWRAVCVSLRETRWYPFASV